MESSSSNNKFKITAISAVGGALEFYDFSIFILFSKIISEAFFKNSGIFAIIATYLIFAAGYFVRPIGGIILAHYGDKYGRKKIFSFTILLMAISTFTIGILPEYSIIGPLAPILLLFLRLLQGAAVGGEIPGAVTFIYEHISEKRTCLAISTLFSGLNFGILLGAVIGTVILHNTSYEFQITYGWRIPFIFGGIIGIIGMYIRNKLKETPVFLFMKENKKVTGLPIIDILKRSKGRGIIGIFLVITNAALVVLFYMYLPTFLNINYNYPIRDVFSLNCIALILCLISNILWGFIADKMRFRLKELFIINCFIITLISIPFFKILPLHSNLYIILFYLLIAIGFGGINSIFTILLADMFDPSTRFTGISVSYNIGFAIAGGLTPLLCELLVNNTSKISPSYYAILVSLIGIISALSLKRLLKN